MPDARPPPAFAGAGPRRVGLKLRMPSRARVDFIRFTIRVRSPTRQSRSRFGRLASSSAIVGTRAMVQWPRSPRSHPRNPRFSNSVSSRSVFARRCSRETATLEAWITCASTPRASSHRASQKPSRPASKASAIRVIVRPALTTYPASHAALQAAVLGSARASCAADAQSREACRRRASSTGSSRGRQ